MEEENKQEKNEFWKEVKKQWKVFLFYGIIVLILSAGINTYISNLVDKNMQGPPCRIDFPVEKFGVNNDTSFNIEYLFINLLDKNLQIEEISAYCYWHSEEEDMSGDISIITPPSIDQISTPRELPTIEASKSEVKTSSCKSPKENGNYKIRVIAKTTGGTCEGDIIMEVKNEQ